MADELLQTIPAGVLGALVAFEFSIALGSWLAGGRDMRWTGTQSLWLTNPFAIRDHFANRRHQMVVLRAQYPVLRTRSHGQQIRRAISQLPPRVADGSIGCLFCRESRLHGRSRCVECGRRLFAPPSEARV